MNENIDGLIFGLTFILFAIIWFLSSVITKKRFDGQMKNPPKPPPKQSSDYLKMPYTDLMEEFMKIRNEILKRDKEIGTTYKNKHP